MLDQCHGPIFQSYKKVKTTTEKHVKYRTDCVIMDMRSLGFYLWPRLK